MHQRLTSLLARADAARRLVADRVPRHLPVKVARRLVAQANIARDARLYEVAAALFEEALRFTPDNPRLHVQCGHMLKEARHFAAAEEHYNRAQQLMPNDADLAVQLGHFYRVSGRPEEAAASYRRALTLNPSWQAAADELALISRGNHGDLRSAEQPDWIVPELLPREAVTAAHPRDAVRVLRLGSGRLRSAGGRLKLIRGLEAIRGYCIASVPIEEVQILLDGVEVGREAMRVFDLPNGGAGTRKYVFNAWHDFTEEQPGRRELSLRFVNARGKSRVHAETVMIVHPEGSAAIPESDAVVPILPRDGHPVVEKVNGLPSVVRSARRTPLPAEVRTILVQRADQLGDLVCSVPAVRRLRDLFPGARIVGLLTNANAELGRSLSIFDDVVVADFQEDPVERRRTMSAEHQSELRRLLAPFAFDIAIDLGEGSESRPLLLLSGARFLYGFKERDWPWLSAGFEMNARDAVNALETTSPARKLLAMIEALGAIRMAPPASPMRPASTQLAAYGVSVDRPYVVLHTGARLLYTRWPGFPELARTLLAHATLDVVVLADDPAELSLYPEDSRLHVLAGKMPFADFQVLLSNASAFVGNDSGPKHLAALLGTKVVSLHMARLNWSEWGQEGDGIIISRRVPCAGCGIGYDAEDCGKDYACIRHIRVEEVFNAILALLGRPASSTSTVS